MKLFVWLQLMDTFYFWKEFPGMLFVLSTNNILLLIRVQLSFPYEVRLMPAIYCCRRDSRKAVYLQHGVFDSSMGLVMFSFTS